MNGPYWKLGHNTSAFLGVNMGKPQPARRTDFKVFRSLNTRWMDNDIYGHVNNVTYYSYFDTAVNGFLISQGVLDVEHGEAIGLVVETGCSYFAPIAFPDEIEVGIRVAQLGTSSVRYELGIFKAGDELAAAQGHFVHVYVGRQSRRPVSLADTFRNCLVPLTMASSA